jgi:hypothetical protein
VTQTQKRAESEAEPATVPLSFVESWLGAKLDSAIAKVDRCWRDGHKSPEWKEARAELIEARERITWLLRLSRWIGPEKPQKIPKKSRRIMVRSRR